jgi:lysophospholipase L1-like esterase
MKKGNIIFLFIMLMSAFMALDASGDEYYDRKVSLFDLLPVGEDDIIFLGNSITDGGEFSELLDMEHVKNRGINSDVIDGVKNRLEQVLNGKPAKVFLLIGINDVSHNLSLATLTTKYRNLLEEMQRLSPDTQIYVQSIMPINNDFKRYKSLVGKEQIIVDFNKNIESLCQEKNIEYINLWTALADANGKMKRQYTNDGLHLTGAGYKAWIEVIKEYLK